MVRAITGLQHIPGFLPVSCESVFLIYTIKMLIEALKLPKQIVIKPTLDDNEEVSDI